LNNPLYLKSLTHKTTFLKVWLMPVILTTQEAKTRKIMVQSQPVQTVCELLSLKYPALKQGWWSGLSGRAPA
jgi:hypothetical protein